MLIGFLQPIETKANLVVNSGENLIVQRGNTKRSFALPAVSICVLFATLFPATVVLAQLGNKNVGAPVKRPVARATRPIRLSCRGMVVDTSGAAISGATVQIRRAT